MIDVSEKLDSLEDCVRLAAHNDAMRGFGCFGPEQARMYSVFMQSACAHRRDIEAEFKKLRKELAAWTYASQNGHPSPCTLGPLCPYCEIESMQRLISDLKYVVGIAERGRGKQIADDESVRDVVLSYVKGLEVENTRLLELVELERTLRKQTAEQRNRMVYLLEEKCLRLEEQLSGLRFELESRK